MDVLLMPDQMILQIHESIGHPIELDRILGDERNFAGTSFVTPDISGPIATARSCSTSCSTRLAAKSSRATAGRRGCSAERVHLIRDGILERPLGGATSQLRAGLPGTSNVRADGWNRPPIDRMANLNLEPGDATFEAMVAGIERGVLMQTNCSWSIDDSRNKFQFGCERGRLIENGKLGAVVKTPTTAASAQPSGAASRASAMPIRCRCWLAALRQGRAVAGDPRRPRVAPPACSRTWRCRRGRGRGMMAPRGETAGPAAMESYFHDVATALDGLIAPGKPTTACFAAETSDFVRFKHGKVRQPGNVVQRYVDVDLILGARHASTTCRCPAISGPTASDCAQRRGAARRIAGSDPDPHLLIATDVVSTRAARGGALPPRRP